jgi:uncharacterized protein (DUF1697 family)
MTTFVALLRAVNVSGQNKIPMAELRHALGGLGLTGVETYLQSGNAVFDTAGDDPAEHAAAVHDLIARDFGHDVRVLVLAADEMQRVSAEMPFVGAAEFDDGWMHATFLERLVEEAAFGALSLPAQGEERAALATGGAPLAGRLIYLYLPHGYGRTKLNNAYFERAFGTPATTRNWRTVLALAEMSARGSPSRRWRTA